jgi:hypothetical protein
MRRLSLIALCLFSLVTPLKAAADWVCENDNLCVVCGMRGIRQPIPDWPEARQPFSRR